MVFFSCVYKGNENKLLFFSLTVAEVLILYHCLLGASKNQKYNIDIIYIGIVFIRLDVVEHIDFQ